MKNLSDEQLIELHKKGDALAFDEIYLRYTKLINSLASSLFIVGGDIDDLKQEGLLGLFQAVTIFDKEKGNFSTIAYRCIKSRMINLVIGLNSNKHKSLNTSVSISSFDVEGEQGLSFSPEDILIGNESLKEKINEITKLLSPFEIKVFNLFLDGDNYLEIAKKMDKTPKSVDNALQRIKDKAKQNFS